MSKRLLVTLSAPFVFGLIACSAGKHATTSDTAANTAASKPSAQAAAPMSPADMEKAFAKAMTPGENHKVLNPLVGKFKTESKFWMMPDSKPEVSKGTADNRWVYNGRYVAQHYRGQWNGKPFEGQGTWGYDNVLGKYQSTWMDSMSTQIMTSTGSYDATNKAITLSGEVSCPMTGAPKAARSVTTILSDYQHRFEMYAPGPDGKEYKTLEIIYTRVGTPSKSTAAAKDAAAKDVAAKETAPKDAATHAEQAPAKAATKS